MLIFSYFCVLFIMIFIFWRYTMKKSTLHMIALILIITISFSLYLKIIQTFPPIQMGYLILFVFCGFCFSFFISVLVHELGHLIGGLSARFKFYSFSVLIFKFIRINDKVRLRLSFSKNIAGYCQMIPSSSENLDKSFYKYVKGSLISSIILLVISLAFFISPLFLEINKYIYVILAPLFIVTVFLIYTNFSSMSAEMMVDGEILRQIKKKTPSVKIHLVILSVQSMFFSGSRPRDIDESLLFDVTYSNEYVDVLLLSYQYSYYLDTNNIEKAIEISDLIHSNLHKLPEIYHEIILGDVFYTELCLKKNISVAINLYQKIEKLINSQLDICSLRFKIAKELYIDQNFDQALITSSKAKSLASSYVFKGIAQMEIDIIDTLSIKAREGRDTLFNESQIDFVSI